MIFIKAVACTIGSFAATIFLWFVIVGPVSRLLDGQFIQVFILAFLMAFCIIVCFFGSLILLKLNKKDKKSDEGE